MVTFAVITVLILLNGVFVAAEFALIGAPRAAIERRASQGNRAAQILTRIMHDPKLQDRYVATAQIGITFASLGLGMYGEQTLATWLYGVLRSIDAPSWLAAHASASALSLGLLTYLHIVLGEMVPKSLALQYSERTALLIVPPMSWTKILIYPLVVSLNALGNGILKIIGLQRQITAGHYVTPEELGYLIKESEAGGTLREESGRLLKELLEFGDLTAGVVMVPRVKIVGILLGSGPDEIQEVISTTRHSRYPVHEGDLDHIVGMVHIKDLFRLIMGERALVRDDLRQIPYIPETMKLEGVLAAMRRKRTHIAVVMDEFGGTAGLITIEDLFEEVVGDIEEEVTVPAEAYFDEKGRLHVSGTVRLEEVGDLLGRTLELEHEGVITLSGLVLSLLERRPRVGDAIVYGHTRFEVTDVRGHGVERCVVTVVQDDDSRGAA